MAWFVGISYFCFLWWKDISPVAKGVWYGELGDNLPPISRSTIMFKVSKKIGCQEKFYL